jgi:hypothetical protein
VESALASSADRRIALVSAIVRAISSSGFTPSRLDFIVVSQFEDSREIQKHLASMIIDPSLTLRDDSVSRLWDE